MTRLKYPWQVLSEGGIRPADYVSMSEKDRTFFEEYKKAFDKAGALEYQVISQEWELKKLRAENEFMLRFINERINYVDKD